MTEDNAEKVAETLANIIAASNSESEDIDIEAIQKTFVNIVNVGSSSPKVGIVSDLNTSFYILILQMVAFNSDVCR